MLPNGFQIFINMTMSVEKDHSYEELQVVLTFASFEEAEEYVKAWGNHNLSPLIVRGSHRGSDKVNGRIQYLCPHGLQRKPKSKGERVHQHVHYNACPVMINVMQNRQANLWRVTKVMKVHAGHMIGRDVYGSYQKVKKLSENALQMVAEMDAVGASRRRVAAALSDKR